MRLPEEEVVPRGGLGVLNEAFQQRDAIVLFAHQHMAQLMRDRQRTQSPHRVDEQRVRPIKAVDEAATLGGSGPAGRLHGAAGLQGQLVHVVFPLIERQFPLAHQAPEIAVGRDVVETVIVHAHVRDVRCHARERLSAPEFEEFAVAVRLELEQGRPELKPLCPLRPTPRRVVAADCADRGSRPRRPGAFDRPDLGG